MEFLQGLFDTEGFVPRWECGNWTPLEGYLHIVSDLLIFLSYAAIPATLAVLVLRRRDPVRLSFVMWLFVAFILSCGVTHLVEAIIFYRPVYRLSGLLKAETAAVSLLTAVVLARGLPSLLALPRVREEKEALAGELATERSTTVELSTARTELEERNADLTLRIRRVMAALNAAGACACRWEVDTGNVQWEKGYSHLREVLGAGAPPVFTNWEGLVGEDQARRLRGACRDACRADGEVEFLIESMPGERALRLRAAPEPEVQGQPRFMVGMFRLF